MRAFIRVGREYDCKSVGHHLDKESRERKSGLTIATHSDRNALLQTAVLAAVAVISHDETVLRSGARAVLDFLLDGATEEALKT